MTPRDRSVFLWHLLKDLPPVAPARLLMAAVFIGGWSLLRALGLPPPLAFVWAGVLAQAAQVWHVLPETARRPAALGQVGGTLTWGVAVFLALLAAQLWWADPVFSQRLVSLYCILYAAIMLVAARAEPGILGQTITGPHTARVPHAFRRRLLQLYAGLAILVLAVNESLLALDTGLGTRVAILALLPVALHYAFHVALHLSAPQTGDHDS